MYVYHWYCWYEIQSQNNPISREKIGGEVYSWKNPGECEIFQWRALFDVMGWLLLCGLALGYQVCQPDSNAG